MNDKFETFLSIAQALNTRLKVVPLLYGSLGLSCLLDTDLNPDDIDMLIEPHFLDSGWQQLQDVMAEFDYHLTDEHEHEFTKDNITVAFADISSLQSFAGINPSALQVTRYGAVQFMELNAEQYLAVYRASQKDGYRKEKRGKNDALKISMIEAYLRSRS